jgi:hypothetical protein
LDRFREAFAALGLDTIARNVSVDGSEDLLWPSQLSLKTVPAGKMSAFLGAYTSLIASARREKASQRDMDIFWCTYPFSVFLIEGGGNEGGLVGVMLSPLHPLRLGWLWAVEQALIRIDDDEQRKGLLQFVEGWNFPFVAPNYTEFGKPLVAMPLSAGEEYLFTGWSFLSAKMDAQKLVAPSRIGATPFPAGASSGLNEGGVAAAARDFLRVHAYLGTLTVDLGAHDRVARCPELDSAVINELLNIAGSRKAGDLPGGVRVFDSANRMGSPPDRDRIMRLIGGQQEPVPLQWRIYEGNGPPSDIRFVQDALTRVGVESPKPDESPAGIAAELPIKRYWTALSKRGRGGSGIRYNPVIGDTGGEFAAFSRRYAKSNIIVSGANHHRQSRPG